MKGKWDVLGSPSKLWQTRRTIFLTQIWQKSASYNIFMPKIYKKVCHAGLYIAKKIFYRESSEFFIFFYKKVCQFGLYIAKIKKELAEHFVMSYVPFPHANQYNKNMVAHFQGIKMFHALRREKLLPSFNIGVILALVQCVVMSFSCQKGKYAGQSAVRKRYVQCGEYITNVFKFIHQKYYGVFKMSLKKREMKSKITYSHKKEGETSTPHVSQNKADCTHVYSLKKFFKSCEKGYVEGPKVAESVYVVDFDPTYPQEGAKYVYDPYTTFTMSLPENSRINKCDSDDGYDIRDHLDTVPIPMREPLNWKDYMYHPNHCKVIYASPQKSNSPPTEPPWTSLPTSSVIENNPNNVHNTIINDSIPPIPPSFQNSVTSQGKKLESIIPQEIKEIISSLPHDHGQTLFNFIMVLGTNPKPLIDKLLQENSELRQLQKDSAPNTQQITKIMELTEQVQSLTTQNEVMNKIIDTQIPSCTAKFNTSTQTNSTPEINVNNSAKILCKFGEPNPTC